MRLALVILGALLVVIPRTSLAQTANRPPEDARILVDVNLFGTGESLAKNRQFQSKFIKFSEPGSSLATYPKPSRATSFGVGGSFMLTRMVGVGVSYSRTTHEDVAELSATIPHPTFFGAPATNTGVTGDALKRREGATDVFVAVVPVRTNRMEWRLLGGPTVFSFKADMVKEVLYVQTFNPATPQQTITINGAETSQVKTSALGFHAGSDVTFFLTRVIGVGGGVRFSYGTVTLDQEPLSNVSQEIRVGGTIGFLGLRLRVGG
jgi:hypothetical protein